MSVIKRPGRFTPFNPADQASGPSHPPSQESIIKSETTKRYLEQYWNKVNERQISRDERYAQLIKSLEESELTEEEKQEVLDEFAAEENAFTRFSRTKLKPDNYEFIKLIGRGGFADVWLVTNKKTGEVNAMKIIRKKDVILSDQINSVKNERDILAYSRNPWVVKLYCSFQDEDHLYLVLEFVQGGNLMHCLTQCRNFPPSVVRFFGGEIALAVNSIHEMGFIHSDLKPDNLLLSASGHLKLTDFGIASQYGKNDQEFSDLLANSQDLMFSTISPIISTADGVKKHRGNIIGSIDYIAPEVLQGKPRTIKSDWWSYGVILYEMLFGYTPFACESKKETALRIIHWRRSLRIPAGNYQRSPQVIDLLRRLLCDEEDRIGFEEIIHHPFFESFNFEDPSANKPPMKPNISDPLDTSHFESFDDVKREDLRASESISKLAEFVFNGFSYKAKPPSTALAKLGVYT